MTRRECVTLPLGLSGVPTRDIHRAMGNVAAGHGGRSPIPGAMTQVRATNIGGPMRVEVVIL